MTDALPDSFLAEARNLNDSQIVTLLGEILEPSYNGPFTIGDDLFDALMPVAKAYRDNFSALSGRVEPETWEAEADYRYEAARDGLLNDVVTTVWGMPR